ncbi:MAG: hypothetical protein Q7S75_01710 [bacterium]|nr:hypothetical protein [bacterium]
MQGYLIITVCTLAVIGVGIVFFSTHKGIPSPNMDFVSPYLASAVATSTEQSKSERIIPEGMRKYQNTAYRFSLFYPQELKVEERSEGGGAATITFQDIEKAEGFQIFIVPYEGTQVSEQRFNQDVPSGVRNNLTNIAVDGATAAAFYSTNIALGATSEVWVVHGRFLYEVTTLKTLDTWLASIMQSWKFTQTL